jgi:hypothetical protein
MAGKERIICKLCGQHKPEFNTYAGQVEHRKLCRAQTKNGKPFLTAEDLVLLREMKIRL